MAVRCELCGHESELEHLYGKWKRSFRSRIYTACPGCLAQKSRKEIAGIAWFYGSFGILGVIILLLNPGAKFGWWLANFFVLIVFEILATIPHELGHALVGHLLRFRIFSIVIGSGKLVSEKVWLGFRWYFRAIPLGGLVYGVPHDTRHYRLRDFLFVLAGPTTNFLLAALAFPFVDFDQQWFMPEYEVMSIPAAIFAANAFTFVGTLIPYRFRSEAGIIATDGLRLLELLYKPLKDLSSQRVLYYVVAAEECRKSKQHEEALGWYQKGLDEFPDHKYLLNGKGVLLLDMRRFTEARRLFLATLQKPELDKVMRCLALNNLAYANILLNDQQFFTEADECSAEAYKQLPWLAAIKGTHGMVLIETGRLEEGVSLLTDSLKESDLAEHKAENAAFLAIAEHRLGNQKKAREYLKLVQKLDPQCFLLERARLAIGE